MGLDLWIELNRQITSLAQTLVIFRPVDHAVSCLIKLVPSRSLEKRNDKHSSSDLCNKVDLTYDFAFVDEESFNNYNPKAFSDLVNIFRQQKNG